MCIRDSWGPLVQQLTKDFIPGFAVAFAIGTYIDLKAMGDGFARLCGVKNENGLLFHILRVASITFVMAVLMSLVMMFLAVGYTCLLYTSILPSSPYL